MALIEAEHQLEHQLGVEHVRKQVDGFQSITAVADLFKIFGDPGRLRILQALAVQELCVCGLAEVLEVSDSAVSHQLRILRQARLVRSRRVGKRVIYALDDPHVGMILHCGFDHIRE